MKKILAFLLVILMFLNSSVLILASAENGFVDVLETDDFKPYVDLLTQKGIIKGYSSTEFAPDLNCTKEQLITFLYRASGSPEVENTASFSDVKSKFYYAEPIAWAKEKEITRGLSDGTFGIGKELTKSEAFVFMYEWAKLEGKVSEDKPLYLTSFSDASEIKEFALEAFAWALYEGIIDPEVNKKLSPNETVTRSYVATVLAKILEKHYHNWSEYTDNGDGTHTRVCSEGDSHTETLEHTYNNGELTVAPTESEKGLVTYTCTKCLVSKTESVSIEDNIVTRADLEKAIVDTAWAYYAKGSKAQYDSTHLSKTTAYLGGTIRLTAESSPEFATSHTNFYSVCSDYVYQAYFEALGIRSMGDINFKHGTSTTYLFRIADNQPEASVDLVRYNDPVIDDDTDACIMRFVDFDAHQKSYASRLSSDTAFGVYSSPSFYDYTSGITFKQDGYDGELHYSYYDENGNKLEATDVQKQNVVTFAKDYKNTMRPGDFFVNNNHALMYIGNGQALHCSGYKIDTTTGYDKEEKEGAIFFLNGLGSYFGQKITSWVVLRPLELIVNKGYDADDGNDIVKDFTIPEKTQTRIENPMLEIDRTVNITPYGSATVGDELTYSVKITNLTDEKNYVIWSKKGYKAYHNLTVTEKIPEGCEFVSASEGGTLENGVITWNIERIVPSQVVDLTYTVKVTPDAKDEIVSEGGMVGNIPSNTIINKVGNRKLTDTEKEKLKELSVDGKDALKQYGTDTDFAEGIYKALGIELSLPTATEIADALFTVEYFAPGTSEGAGGLYASNFTKKNMFVKQSEVSEEHKSLQNMLIGNYYGGYRFFAGEEEKFNYATNVIKEFRTEYLEAGDVIVYAKSNKRGDTTLSSDFGIVMVMVWDGEKLLYSSKTSSGETYKVIEGSDIKSQLLSALTIDKDLFFALRPLQDK